MTVYYIDPVAGSDAANGTDWSTPKKTLSGITSITPSTDSIKYKKTCVEVTTSSIYSAVKDAANLTVSASMDILQLYSTMSGAWQIPGSGSGAVSSSASSAGSQIPDTTGTLGTWNKITLSATPVSANAKLAWYDIGSTLDLSAYQELGYWLFLTTTSSYLWHDPIDTVVFKLCSDATGDTPVHTIIPTQYQTSIAGVGRGCYQLYVPGGNLSSTVRSVAIYAGSSVPPISTVVSFILPAAFKTASPLRYGDLIMPNDRGTLAKVSMIKGGTAAGGQVYIDNATASTVYFPTAFTDQPLKVFRPYHVKNADTRGANPLAVLKHGGTSTSVRALISGGWDFSSHVQDGYTLLSENNQRFSLPFSWDSTFNTTNFITLERIGLMDFNSGFFFHSSQGSGGWDVALTDCIMMGGANVIYWMGGANRNFTKIVMSGGWYRSSFSGGLNYLTGCNYTFTNVLWDHCPVFIQPSSADPTGTFTFTGCKWIYTSNNFFYGSSVFGTCTYVFDNCYFQSGTSYFRNDTVASVEALFTFQGGTIWNSFLQVTSGRVRLVGLVMSDYLSVSSSNFVNIGISNEMYNPVVIWENCTLKLSQSGGLSPMQGQWFKNSTVEYTGGTAQVELTDVWFDSCTLSNVSVTTSNFLWFLGSASSTVNDATLTPSIKFETCTMSRVRIGNSGHKTIVVAGGSINNTVGGIAPFAFNGSNPNMLVNNMACNVAPTWSSNNPATDRPARIHNFNQQAGDHRVYYAHFKIETDSGTVHTAGGKSWKITGPSASWKCIEGFNKVPVARVAFKANKAVTASLWVNCASGSKIAFCADAYQINVAQTAQRAISATTGAWEQLVITFTPTEAGVMEFWISPVISSPSGQIMYYDDLSFTQAP